MDKDARRRAEHAENLFFVGLIMIIGVIWFLLDYVSDGNIAAFLFD